MTMRLCLCSLWALLLGGVCFAPITGRASLYVSIEQPGVQSTTVSTWFAAHGQNVTVNTETFNELNQGPDTSFAFNSNSSIGMYTSRGMAIMSANQFGGANGSNYMAVGAESGTYQATLTLTNLQGYFGIYWSAGDAYNELKFYNNNVLVGDYTTANVISFLQATGEYNEYLGNPSLSNRGQDSGNRLHI